MKILLTLIFFVVACATGPPHWNYAVARHNLLKLQVGMDKEEVISVIGGNPYKNEAFSTPEGDILEAYFYLTEYKTDERYKRLMTDDVFTPLIFINNELVGWGWSFYQDTTKKYDIDIEIKGETP